MPLDCLEIMTPPNQLQLRGGSTLRNTGGVLFNVHSYIMHPSYNARLEYDIGLLRTPDNSPIVGTNIAFVPLAPICPDTEICCGVCAGVSVSSNLKFDLLVPKLIFCAFCF